MASIKNKKNALTITKISVEDRCRQWWHARWDAKRGIPVLPANSGGLQNLRGVDLTTPHLNRLFQERDEILESARNRVIVQTRDARAEVAERQRHVTNLLEEIERLQAQVTDAKLDEKDLARVGAGEAKLPAETVRSRRQAEADRLITPIKARIERCEQEIANTREQIALIETTVVALVRDAQAVAERICSYTDARVSRYWRVLSRRHPQGRQLAELHRPARQNLAWITEPDHWAVLNNKEQS
jgi:hypothetical protein